MIREIEFRGWRADGGGWAYGSLMMVGPHDQQFSCILEKEVERRKIRGQVSPAYKRHDVVRDTVGQYIGRKDINGRKAFEDDLFRCQNGREWRIEYDEARTEYMASKASRRVEGMPLRELEIVEIIGNIHE